MTFALIYYTITSINSPFSNKFLKYLKKAEADITTVFKNDEKFLKAIYRPVSILPALSLFHNEDIHMFLVWILFIVMDVSQ